MQYPSYNVSDCPLFHHFTDLYFHYSVQLFSHCHQLLSYVFSNENSFMQVSTLGENSHKASLSWLAYQVPPDTESSVSQPAPEVIPLQITCLYFASLSGCSLYCLCWAFSLYLPPLGNLLWSLLAGCAVL